MGSEAVFRAQAAIVRDAIGQLNVDESLEQRARHLLESIDPAQIDATLEAHVDRNAAIDSLPLSTISPEAAALLLMLVRRNEAGRRMLPSAPIVSARGFAERLWPVQLAWSDMGTRGEERLRASDLAEAEYRRMERKGSERSEQARGEILGMLGEMLGLTPEQQAELMSEESQEACAKSCVKWRQSARVIPAYGGIRRGFRRACRAARQWVQLLLLELRPREFLAYCRVCSCYSRTNVRTAGGGRMVDLGDRSGLGEYRLGHHRGAPR